MKIAYLSTFYPLRGGIAQFNASLYRAFENEHSIKAFTFKRQYPDLLFPGKTQYVGENDLADPIESLEILDTINPFSYYKTAKKISEFQPDLILMKYWMSFFGPSLGTVIKQVKKKNPATKVITILDNVIPHEKRFFDDAFTKYFLKQNDGFVVMSDKVKQDLLSFQPNAKILEKEHPIYNHFGAKIPIQEAKAKLNIPKEKKVLLFFGFIRDYKGLSILLDAMALLPDDYLLIVAGEVYGSFEKYQAQIDALGISSKVLLHNDYISDKEVPLFFSASDVCILPYISATQSGITYISYHFDLPIIATDVGGLKEIVHHNNTGLIVDNSEKELLKKSILTYFEKDLKKSFNKNIKNLKNNLSWENFANAIANFINSLS